MRPLLTALNASTLSSAYIGEYSGSAITYTGAPATFKAISGLASGNITVVGGNFACSDVEDGTFVVSHTLFAFLRSHT